ncbi:LysR family transcriptional regulator [Marinomonas epiphytica]
MDRLIAAKVFADVALTGSFTQTSERLDMSRPMVTRYIETMENWLNCRLLHRTTRKVSLTTAGEGCLAEINNWLLQAESISNMTKASEQLVGNIRLATSMSFGFSHLVRAVQGFMAEHPKVKVDIDLRDSVSDLTESRIDLAVRIASNPDPSLIGKPIAVCQSVIVAAPDYLKGRADIVQPEDLQAHECLGYKNFQQHVWYVEKGDQSRSIEVDCRLSANEATMLLHAALNGAGLAIQPKYLVAPYLKSGELSVVLPEWKLKEMEVFLLYSSRKHMSPVLRALIDYLSDYFADYSWDGES